MASSLNELALLRAENARLKALLTEHGIPWQPESSPKTIPIHELTDEPALLSPEEKIQLFRRLFRGRDDVYPVRWKNQSGKAGYSPVCANEWRRGYCQKPRIKCADCAHAVYVPPSEFTFDQHLRGKITAGIYPLLKNDHCYFLAIDFDDADWREDAKSVMQTALEIQLPAALEISRSGEGAHLWVFFSSAVPAREARRLGAALISATCARTRQLKLESYDRLFPNQDTLPKGGFGNLIALPLQKQPRELGRSVFVDANLQPYADQWGYLQTIQPMVVEQLHTAITTLVGDQHPLDIAFAEVVDENSDTPWLQPPSPKHKIQGVLPKAICATLGNMLYIEKAGLPQPLMNRLVRLAAFQNPEFYKAQALRLSTWDTPRIIGCAENHPKHIALPRGCLDEVQSLLKTNKISLRLDDVRVQDHPISATFLGKLRPDQQIAMETMLPHEFGVMVAPTAFGKTVTAAAVIANRQVRTLILVHRTELMKQWQERLMSFLACPDQKVGMIGGGKNKPTGSLDVAVIQSLIRREDLSELLGQYSQIIIDECHHLSAQSFEAVLKQASPRYVLGLSATPIRRDGHQPIIFMQCGPIRHVAKRPAHVPVQQQVFVRHLPAPELPEHGSIQEIFRLLASDARRNQSIIQDVMDALHEGRKVLLLTERSEHLQLLGDTIKESKFPCFVLHGRMSRKERQATVDALAALPPEAPHLLLATGKLVGEGFDHPPLDTLVLAMPISWKGTLQQYAGRLHREHIDKSDVRILDYAELDHPQLARMWEKRMGGYRTMGYQITAHQT